MKEKSLVLYDWSPQPATELAIERAGYEAVCNGIRGDGPGEGIARLQRIAMTEPEGVSMEVIAARPGAGADDAAG